jgi:hypothetical protein
MTAGGTGAIRACLFLCPPGVDGTPGMQGYERSSVRPACPPEACCIMFAGEHDSLPPDYPRSLLVRKFEACRLDLIAEAEANGHLEFDDDHAYQYTFGVRKRFQSTSIRSPVAERAPRPLALR